MAHPMLDLLFAPPDRADHGSPGRRRGASEERHAGETNAPDHSEDAQLDRLRAGDPTVVSELYQQYYVDLWAFAYRYTTERATAEDVVHDVFMGVWQGRSRLSVTSTLRAYLFGAVRNRALNAVAFHHRHEFSDLSVLGVAAPSVSRPEGIDPQSPERDVESAELERAIFRAVNALPERQQLAFRLRLAHDMTYAEIATVLGVTKGAVAQLIRKGQDKLRLALRDFLP